MKKIKKALRAAAPQCKRKLVLCGDTAAYFCVLTKRHVLDHLFYVWEKGVRRHERSDPKPLAPWRCEVTARSAQEVGARIMADYGIDGEDELAARRIAAAIDAAEDAALQRAALEADAEAAEYLANSKACDAMGDTYSGTADIHGKLACDRVAARIRALTHKANEPKP